MGTLKLYLKRKNKNEKNGSRLQKMLYKTLEFKGVKNGRGRKEGKGKRYIVRKGLTIKIKFGIVILSLSMDKILNKDQKK